MVKKKYISLERLTDYDALIKAEIDERINTHNHDDKYDAKDSAANALVAAKEYADSAAITVKNELLNGAGAAYDTLKELGDLIDENTDALEALETVAANKTQVQIITWGADD